MEKILTISVAAYNVEKYIRQTLDSCMVPEILNDLEILVLDDRATDKTAEPIKIWMSQGYVWRDHPME